jgi:hypothetical protein
MKSTVAITLILAGVFVVALPPLSDAWLALMVTQLLEHGYNNVTLNCQMGDLYRIGCVCLGALMILAGLRASVARVWETPAARMAGQFS